MLSAKLECDANGCHNEIDLELNHPDDAVIEVEKLEEQGWDYDWDSGISYCSKCRLLVEGAEHD
ncbi:hypothetical protein [Vibrio sp. LaRot3]|uniref:hypothetical protein n=1 Tax=Vibrio sp. LaRot3 TaxID=2998829 RepID=UPI0022CDEFE8|nr:hypothetical protein [Vibrio sp. LaRot3]MDA0148830.1 hypothetical protein [Vibrio sp. LaRot3]